MFTSFESEVGTSNTELSDWIRGTSLGVQKVSFCSCQNINIIRFIIAIICCLAIARKTRILDVVYNASNNELVRTKTLVKNAIVQIDATPFRQWFEAHYLTQLGIVLNKLFNMSILLFFDDNIFMKLLQCAFS